MKHLRLWITRYGKPLYIEMLDGDLTVDQVTIIREQLKTIRASKEPTILSDDWEVRVLA